MSFPTTAAEAEPVVRALLAEWRAARDSVRDNERRVRGLTKVLDGYVHLYPQLTEVVAENVPTRRHR